jgi:hypothetical protein
VILQILDSHVDQFIRRLVVCVPQGLGDVRLFWIGDGLLEFGPELPCFLRLGLDVPGVVGVLEIAKEAAEGFGVSRILVRL